MADVQLEQILKREDVPLDVKQIVMNHLQEKQKEEEVSWRSTEQFTKFKQTKKDLQKSEESLKKSEKRLSDFMNSATDIIQIFDSDLNYISVNQAAENILNLSKEEIIGKNYLDFFPYLKGTDRLKLYKDVMKTGKPYVREETVPKFIGKLFLIRAFKVGNGLGMIISDVSENKKTYEKLKESEENYRSFVEKFQGIAFRGKKGFTPVFFHGNVEEITGYTEEEFIAGQPTWDQVIHPDDIPKFLEETQAQQIASRPNRSIESTHRIIHKNGQIRWVVEHIQAIDDDSDSRGIVQGTIQDITDRKKAEEALIESNKRLIEVQRLAKVGFLDWNLKNDRIHLSDEVIDLYGLNPKNKWLTPDFVAQVVHQDDMNHVQSNLEMALKGIKKYSIDHRVVRPDGAVLWVHTEAELAHDEEGNPQNLLGTVMDITERKQMEEELRESEEKLRDFMDAATENFCLFDSKLNFIDLNLLAQREINELGIDPNKVIGMNLLDINPTSKETGIYDKFMEVIRTGEPFSGDNMIPDPEFGDRYFSMKAFKVGNGLGLIATDITERKQMEESLKESEERYRIIFNETPISLWEEDFSAVKRYFDQLRLQGVIELRQYLDNHPHDVKKLGQMVKIIDVNNTTLELYKAKNRQEFFKGLPAFYNEEATELFKEELIALFNGNKIFEGEFPDRKFTGERMDLIIRLSVVSGFEETLTRIIVSIIEITDRKRAEKVRKDLEKRQSAFVSMTSHELRTPVTVIKGYTEFLKENIEEIESISRSQVIQSILRNVLRLERLIEGVADITRMDQGIFKLNTSICDFSEFLEESISPYKDLYGNKFTFHRNLEFDLPVFLNIDIDRIGQVLDNLMDNANKNTPEDGRIILTPTILSNTIQIAISDTGVGIHSNDLSRIFEQFVSITTDQASGGTGIGLYVSRIICETHEGTLTAHSEGKNQGATFIVEIPQWFEE